MEKSNFTPKWYINREMRKIKIYYTIVICFLLVVFLLSFYFHIYLRKKINIIDINKTAEDYSEVIKYNNILKEKNKKDLKNLSKLFKLDEKYDITNLNIEEDRVYIQFNVKNKYIIRKLDLELEDNFNAIEIKATNVGDSYSLEFYGGGFKY